MFIFVVMNTHSKLREIGFIKTAFHKPYEYNDGSHNNMVLDNVTRKWDYIKKTGQYGWTEIPKIHPKSNSFWKLVFNEKYTIWISVKNNIIDKIWLEDKETKRPLGYRSSVFPNPEDPLKTIYTYETINRITSKKQIINLLPMSIRRDFIIRDLLK